MMTERQESEPSMNEILASIRQIISDPSKVKGNASFKTHDEEDILDLTHLLPDETNSSSPYQKARMSTPEKRQPVLPKKSLSHPVEPKLREGAATLPQDDLMRLLKEQRQGPIKDEPLTFLSKGQTLEDLVRDSMNPLIKEWLDAHLPSLVKEVVNEKVEKIFRQFAKVN